MTKRFLMIDGCIHYFINLIPQSHYLDKEMSIECKNPKISNL